MTRPRAVATEMVDDVRVRVTRFDFAPEAGTGWHVHEHDYVVTAITDCRMRLEEPGGAIREVRVESGQAYLRHRPGRLRPMCRVRHGAQTRSADPERTALILDGEDRLVSIDEPLMATTGKILGRELRGLPSPVLEDVRKGVCTSC